MLPITQRLGSRCFWALFIAFSSLSGCGGEASSTTQNQRRIGEARLQDDLFVSLTYGSVRGFTSNAIVMRSASPLVDVTIESGPAATGPLDVELRNQHLQAELQVSTVAYLDIEDLAGCPVVSGFEIDCVAAAESIGTTCESSGQCADGLRCAMGSCEATDDVRLCEIPQFERLRGQETSLDFQLEIEPCTRVQMSTVLPETDEILRFGVVGPTGTHQAIEDLAGTFRDAELDFVVLLGDNAESNSVTALSDLERVVTLLGTPAVVLAGTRELGAENGQQFLRRFGPHDHYWSIKGARLFTFFSAQGSLGTRGLSRLTGFLQQLDGADDGALLAVTHLPPFDPNALRDNSFRSDVEAAQVQSLLEEYGVHQLYAGGLATGYQETLGLETYVTTARGTVANPRSEWLYVEVDSAGEGREAGTQVVRVERR